MADTDVDRDARDGHAGQLPASQLLQGLGDGPFAHAEVQATVLGQRDELAGREHLRAAHPAHQRLDADDAVVAGVDDGLVVEHQLVAVQHGGQGRLQLEVAAQLFAIGVVVDQQAVAPLLTRHAHGHVGLGQQHLEIAAVAREPGGADGGAQHQVQPVDLEGATQVGLDDLGGLAGGILVGQVGEDQRVFVTRQPADQQIGHVQVVACLGRVGLGEVAEGMAQAVGHVLQHAVAGTLAEGLVDAAEPVDVEHHDGGDVAGGAAAAQQHLTLLHEGGPAEQAGERITVGLFALAAEGIERFGERIACAPLAFCSRTVGTCRLGLGKIDTMQQALGQLGPLLGLLAVIGGAGRQGLAEARVVVVVGQHDDRDLAAADGLAQVPDRRDAIRVGEGVIDHDGIGHDPLQQRDGLGQLVGHLDVDAPLAQPHRDHVLPGRIVLHQQYTQFAQCCFQHHDIPKSDFAGKMAVP